MSSKRRKNPPRGTYSRGPSRPVDPRRAPGYYGAPRRRGLDPFAMALIVVSGFVVIVLLAIIALNTSNSSNTGTAAAVQSNGSTVTPNWTMTTVAFSTVTAPDVLPRISIQDTKALYDAGNVKIIDVRLKNLYDAGHIKGAVNVPEAEVSAHVKDLPKTGNLVLYCDCPHDEESAGTAYSLKVGGYTNMKILQGPTAYTLWKNAGYPIEKTTTP
jgi:rhodanese-related sulfurtransferase